jgi:nitronate monooxygenase
MTHPALIRANSFCAAYDLRIPILQAPMASACPPSLAIAVANAGGMGGCGALLMQPAAINAWASEVRATTNGAFQLNLWIPDPPPVRDAAAETAVRRFLADWGPGVAAEAGNVAMPDFAAQCDALLQAGPAVISSIMGVYPPDFVAAMKARGIRWWATVTTVREAQAAEAAGADAVVAQGMEAGGHRGAFDPAKAEAAMVGLFALLPAVADAVNVPVIATGGISDPRGVAAALILGACAVQVGTGFLRAPEAKLPAIYADAIGRTRPEDTLVTRAFSGRPGRSVATAYARAAAAPDAPPPAPYPVQRGLTQPMRDAAAQAGDFERMQAWAGQAAALAPSLPAGQIARDLWDGAQALLGGGLPTPNS